MPKAPNSYYLIKGSYQRHEQDFDLPISANRAGIGGRESILVAVDDRTTMFRTPNGVLRILSCQPQADCFKAVANPLYRRKHMEMIHSHNIFKSYDLQV